MSESFLQLRVIGNFAEWAGWQNTGDIAEISRDYQNTERVVDTSASEFPSLVFGSYPAGQTSPKDDVDPSTLQDNTTITSYSQSRTNHGDIKNPTSSSLTETMPNTEGDSTTPDSEESKWLNNTVGTYNSNNWGSYNLLKTKYVIAEDINYVNSASKTKNKYIVRRPTYLHAYVPSIGFGGELIYGFSGDGNPITPYDYQEGEIITVRKLRKPDFLGVNTHVYNEIRDSFVHSSETNRSPMDMRPSIEHEGSVELALDTAAGYGWITTSYIYSAFEDVNTLNRTRTGIGGGEGEGTCECPTLTVGDCPQAHLVNCGSVGALWV